MKKRTLLLFLLVMLALGTTSAQSIWQVDETVAEEIKSGEDHCYVLQEGLNDGGWAKYGYMNTGSAAVVEHIDNTCIYHFIQDGTFENEGTTYALFVLKNRDNGKYLAYQAATNTSTYTKSMSEAFHFTARKAKETGVDKDADLEVWSEYSNAVSKEATGAEAAGIWVFCSNTEQRFIGFARNPSLWKYFDTNTWFVYEAHETTASAADTFFELYENNFPTGLDETAYPVGKNPGCISKELYDELKAVYDEATALTNQQSVPEETYAAMNKRIVQVFEKVKNGRVQITAGYYIIQNKRRTGYLYDNNGTAKFTADDKLPETWTIQDCKIIWELSDAQEKGKYYYKNFQTNMYLGKGGNSYPVVAERDQVYFPEYYKNDLYLLFDGENYGNCSWGGDLCVWNDKADEGNHYRYIRVNQHIVDSLQEAVNQELRNQKLSKVLFDTYSKFSSLEYKNGFSTYGEYFSYAPGLVTEIQDANATELSEGSPANLFDGQISSYYHTAWQGEAPQNDWHWIQVDLGKDVSDLWVKFSCRENFNWANPTEIALVAPKAGETDKWTDTLTIDSVEYNYPTRYTNGIVDATTSTFNVKFNHPVRQLRFAVTKTASNDIYGFGPFWYLSELRFFDSADMVANPYMEMVDADIVSNLKNAIATAQVEVKENKATDKTYNELVAAYEAFTKAYPDPKTLNDNLKKAKSIAQNADDTSDEIGYYKEGAPAALLAAIEAIEKEANSHLLSTEEIIKLNKQLDEALDVFYGQLIIPTSGKIYHICNNGKTDTDDKEPDQYGSYLYSRNADQEDFVKWGYKGDVVMDSRFNTMWLLESNAQGKYSFKNMSNGLYIDNPYAQAEESQVKNGINIAYSTTPKYFSFVSSQPGSLLIVFDKGHYFNATWGNVVCSWDNIYDTNSQFKFEEVLMTEFYPTNYIEVEENKTQIITLPIDIMGVYTNNEMCAMKILGKKGNEIQLATYGETEVIPAGTPFVVKTEVEEKNIETALAFNSWEDFLKADYNYNVVIQNGLVSAPKTIKPNVGYGLIIDNQVKISEKDDVVAAGSGFFNKDIPETEVLGNYTLTISGDLIGTGTAIEVIENKNEHNHGVYSISGVKLGGNNVLNRLSKGVYIVNGKKLIK